METVDDWGLLLSHAEVAVKSATREGEKMRQLCSVLLVGLLAISGLVACNKHGKKLTFKKGEVFYKSPVTKAQAHNFGTFMVKMKYFDNSKRKSVQLLKVGGTYQVRFVVNKSVVRKPGILVGFQAIASMTSGEVFEHTPVEVHLCDKKLKSFKTLGPFKSFGHKVEAAKGEVYYLEPVTKPEAEKLAQLLKKIRYFDGKHKSIQMLRKGTLTQLRFVVHADAEKNPKTLPAFKQLGTNIQTALFPKGKVEVHLCDPAFNTVKVVP